MNVIHNIIKYSQKDFILDINFRFILFIHNQVAYNNHRIIPRANEKERTAIFEMDTIKACIFSLRSIDYPANGSPR